MVTVYIIHSESSDRYYTGFTQEVERRLKEHRKGKTSSIQFADDWKLVWSKEVSHSSEARTLEKRIKKRGAKRFISDQAS